MTLPNAECDLFLWNPCVFSMRTLVNLCMNIIHLVNRAHLTVDKRWLYVSTFTCVLFYSTNVCSESEFWYKGRTTIIGRPESTHKDCITWYLNNTAVVSILQQPEIKYSCSCDGNSSQTLSPLLSLSMSIYLERTSKGLCFHTLL